MATTYEGAVAALYQAPLDKFVEERKRLAAELKAGGDKPAAARFVKLARPTIAAWAVNQLYWQARATFDELFAASQRLRAGDRGAATARREAMAKLRSRAIAILGEAGHPTPEATLRRLANDLSALAAAGGFDPDPPGALTSDRETLGFDITGLVVRETPADAGEDVAKSEPTPPAKAPAAAKAGTAASKASRARELAEAKQRRETDETRAREERQRTEQERRRQAEEAARIAAERRRLEAALRVAKSQLETRSREVDELRRQLVASERMLEEARAKATEIEARLAALETPR